LDRAATEIANRNYDYRVAINHDDEFGRLSRTFNSMCDSIQQARDELISQERLNAVGHISSSIVHDLRNPLAAIYSGAEMLVDTAGLSEEQSRRLASNIFRASRRIQTLLTELTQGVGDRRDAPEPCILSEIIESAVDIVTPAAQAKGIRLAIQIPDQIEIVAARVRLQRVFLNLMNNAIEAMTDGGQLELTAMREPRSVVVHVDDSGPGLSEKVRKHLFRPFFSAGKRSGLGLGLALSRQTMLSMEGDLWASEKKGPGARFCVRIPIATSHTTEDHARTSEEHGLPRTPEFKLPK
jgi:signal transduction histidine kinase